jgi:hypothetical protein
MVKAVESAHRAIVFSLNGDAAAVWEFAEAITNLVARFQFGSKAVLRVNVTYASGRQSPFYADFQKARLAHPDSNDITRAELFYLRESSSRWTSARDTGAAPALFATVFGIVAHDQDSPREYPQPYVAIWPPEDWLDTRELKLEVLLLFVARKLRVVWYEDPPDEATLFRMSLTNVTLGTAAPRDAVRSYPAIVTEPAEPLPPREPATAAEAPRSIQPRRRGLWRMVTQQPLAVQVFGGVIAGVIVLLLGIWLESR